MDLPIPPQQAPYFPVQPLQNNVPCPHCGLPPDRNQFQPQDMMLYNHLKALGVPQERAEMPSSSFGPNTQLAGDVVPFPISGATAARNMLRSQLRAGKSAYESTLPDTNIRLPIEFLNNAINNKQSLSIPPAQAPIFPQQLTMNDNAYSGPTSLSDAQQLGYGSGVYSSRTGMGFLTNLLNQLAKERGVQPLQLIPGGKK